MLALYMAALRIRRAELGDGDLSWLSLGDGVLGFVRESGLACVVNLGTAPASLPAYKEVLLAGGPLDGELLAVDTAVWLRL